MTRAAAFVTLLLTLAFSPAALAQEVPDPQDGSYVHDFAGMLDDDTEAALEEDLGEFEDVESTEIAVATVDTLGGYAIEEYSLALARKWGVGQKENDNGAVLVIAEREREMRIEVGYGLEGSLTDATSKLIIEREITPSFRDGDFDEGVTNGVDAMMAAVRGEYSAEEAGGDGIAPIAWILMAIGVFSILGLASRGGHPRGGRRYWSSGAGWVPYGTGSSGFSGGFSGGSAGGGGGFGGGGFGGGGASGGW